MLTRARFPFGQDLPQRPDTQLLNAAAARAVTSTGADQLPNEDQPALFVAKLPKEAVTTTTKARETAKPRTPTITDAQKLFNAAAAGANSPSWIHSCSVPNPCKNEGTTTVPNTSKQDRNQKTLNAIFGRFVAQRLAAAASSMCPLTAA